MESGFSGYGKSAQPENPANPKNPKNHFPSTEQNPKNPKNPKNHFANLGGSGSGFSGYGDLASRSEVVIRVNRVSWKWLIGLWKHNPGNPETTLKLLIGLIGLLVK